MNTVTISGGGYTAALLPLMGANLVSLKYKELDILHTPDSEETLKNDPYSYGIPILCPPNKISGAKFNYKGREFSYPVNMADGACLHGVLHTAKWKVEKLGPSYILMSVNGRENEGIKNGFGENFEFLVEYSLSEEGLKQVVTAKNNEDYPVPFGLSFHTAFCVPFDKKSSKENVLLQMPIISRCKLNEKLYPALEDEALLPHEQLIASEGYEPLKQQIDMLFNRDMAKENLLTLYDKSTGVKVCYKACEDYIYWVAWNDTADRGFIGLEPQTWISNAPVYLEQGKGNYGVIEIAPRSQKSLTTNIFVKEENAL